MKEDMAMNRQEWEKERGSGKKMGWMRDVTRRGGRGTGEERRERKRDSLSGQVSSRRSEVCRHGLPSTLAGLGLCPQRSLLTKDAACWGKLFPRPDWSSLAATSGTMLV